VEPGLFLAAGHFPYSVEDISRTEAWCRSATKSRARFIYKYSTNRKTTVHHMILALNLPMALVRSLNVEMPFEGAARDMTLPPTTSHRTQNGKPPRLGKSTSGSPDLESSPSLPELKFVTTTGPPSQRSKESRLMVRSHAMQAFLREKKSDGKGSTRKETEVQGKSLDDAIGRFKLSSWSRKSSKKATTTKDEKTLKQGRNDNIAKVSSRWPRTLEPVPSPVRATTRFFE
jgi:hypothetical protein